MAFTYNITDPRGTYFVSFATVQWIDVFSRKRYQDILLDSFKYCQKEKGLLIHAWCIMSNHVHLIASTKSIKPNLSDVLRDFKKFTSVQIKAAIEDDVDFESRKNWMMWLMKSAGKANPNNTHFQLWQQENHPIEIYSKEFMTQKMDRAANRYTHYNPVEAGLVLDPWEYRLSSAIDYFTDKKGLLEIDFV